VSTKYGDRKAPSRKETISVGKVAGVIPFPFSHSQLPAVKTHTRPGNFKKNRWKKGKSMLLPNQGKKGPLFRADDLTGVIKKH